MSSLVPGIDRIETPLPFTDAGFFAHRLPSGDGAAPTRQMLLDALPEESLHLLVSLLEEDAPETTEGVVNEQDAAAAGSSGPVAVEQRDGEGGNPESESRPSHGFRRATAMRASQNSRPTPPLPRKPARASGASTRSAAIKAHDEGLRQEIAALTAQMESAGLSAAAKHGLKRQIQAKQALLKKDAVASLAHM